MIPRRVSAFVLAVALAMASARAQGAVDPQLVAAVIAADDTARAALFQSRPDIGTTAFLAALVARGNAARGKAQLDEAERDFRAALSAAEHFGNQNYVAVSYNNLGIVAGQRSDLAASTSFFNKAMDTATRAGDLKTVQSAWGNLGIVQRHLGELDLAEVSMRRSIQLAQQLGDTAAEARSLNNLGLVYSNRGDSSRALEHYLRSLRLKEDIGVDAKDMSSTLSNIGGLYDEQGDYAQAMLYYERAVDVLERGGAPPGVFGPALTNTGHLYLAIGEFDKARAMLERARAIAEVAGNREQLSTVLYNLAALSRAESKMADAERYNRESLAIREATGELVGTVESLTELSNLMDVLGRAAEGLPLALRAVSLASDGHLLHQLWKAQMCAGHLQRVLGDMEQARAQYEAAVSTIETLRQLLAGGERAQRQFLDERVGPYYGLASVYAAANRPFDALAAIERSKARALIDIMATGRPASRLMTDAQRQQERQLTDAVIALNDAIDAEASRPSPDHARLDALGAALDKARTARDAYTAELYAAQPDLQFARGNPPTLTRESLGRLVTSDVAVVTFLLNVDDVWAIAVTSGADGPTVTTRRLKRSMADIGRRAEAFSRQVASRDLSFASMARGLYADLLAPLEPEIGTSRRLVIVPDGPLWQIPFQALISGRGRFLVEERPVSYAPSLSALAALEERRRARGMRAPFLLALGDPAVPGTSGTLRGGETGRLPEAGREVRAIGRLYGAGHSAVFTGDAASESTLRNEIARASIVHVATHGVLDDHNPMYSHLALAPGPAATAAAPSTNDHKTDGRLEAWEVLDLGLTADLAVLSACETARGGYGWGEGVIGLSWSLFAAGASTAVVSQWEVDSTSTTRLMIAFHEALLARRAQAATTSAAADALRSAALAVMKTPAYRHPFYWAGFIAVGAK